MDTDLRTQQAEVSQEGGEGSVGASSEGVDYLYSVIFIILIFVHYAKAQVQALHGPDPFC